MGAIAGSGEIRVGAERAGRVAVVEIRREQARNALTHEMLLEVAEVFGSPPQGARCVLLTGAGRAFCAGVDGRNVVRKTLEEGWSADFEELLDATAGALRAMISCPVPIVAAVDGPAAGAGFTYALLADSRIVTQRTKLIPGHLTIGSPLDGGSSYALKKAFSPGVAMELLLSPTGLDGEDLIARGLAEPTMASADDLDGWLDTAERLAEIDPLAVTCARELTATVDFETQWQAEVAWLRRFVDSGRLLQNMNTYWESRAAAQRPAG